MGVLEGEDVAYLPLNGGRRVIVDRRRLPELYGVWTFDGKYIYQIRNGVKIKLHRLILGILGCVSLQGDHRFGNIFDCRESQLRACSNLQNSRNRKCSVLSRTGFKGVRKQRDKYEVRITVDKQKRYVGLYNDVVTAARAYDSEARRHFGAYARTNFPED